MQYVDFHSHILPHMDDGSKSLEMSSIMLELLKEENVCIVFATPHYYCYRESQASFLARREECVQKLCDYLYENGKHIATPEIRLGAEIRLIKDMPEILEIEQFLLEGTSMALFELPYDRYQIWMGENIHNISVKYQLTPVIAHVERYIDVFRESDYEELFSIPNAVYQIGTNFINKRKEAAFTANLLRAKLPILFGSDCHNITDRKPIMGTAFLHLKKFCAKYKIQEETIFDLFKYQKSLV